MLRFHQKPTIVRALCVCLMLFSAVLGFTWRQYGFCLGDLILTGLGFPAWSNGTTGIHYTAIYAGMLFLCAYLLFLRVRKASHKKK